MIKSTASGPTPAFSNARRAATVAMSLVNSFSAANRRSLIPVRVVIHWSVVSTIFSKSWLRNTRAGT
jgi:hypothetical protein